MTVQRRSILQASAGLGLLAQLGLAPSAQAAAYLRWLVAFPAGGGADILSRLISRQIGIKLNENVVVENKPGGATIIATQTLLGAPADGATVMLGNDALSANPSLFKNLPYKTLEDIEFIALVARIPMVMVVHPDFPAKTAKEVLASMKKNAAEYSYATWGIGSVSHLAMEELSDRQGIKLTHIPYQGSVGALKDMMGNMVTFMFGDMAATLPLIRSGKLRAVAVPSKTRSAVLPDVPTIDELGFAGFDFFSWQGLIARKGADAATIEKLSATAQAVMKMPEVENDLLQRGMEPWPNNAARFREQVRNDTEKMRNIIVKRGITLS